MTWELMIVGLVGLAVGLTASYGWRGLTLDATWALVVEGWVDLDVINRKLVAAEAELKAARMDVATHKARADGMEARAAASAEPYVVATVGRPGILYVLRYSRGGRVSYWPSDQGDFTTESFGHARRFEDILNVAATGHKELSRNPRYGIMAGGSIDILAIPTTDAEGGAA